MQTITRFTSLGLAGGLALPALLTAQSPTPAPHLHPGVVAIEETVEELDQSLFEVHEGLALAQSGYGSGGYGASGASDFGGSGGPAGTGNNPFLLDGPRGSTDVLLLHSTEPTIQMRSELQEDLPVMSRVLERAVSPDLANAGRRVMGLNLMFAPGKSSTQSIYLEDYGAIFTLQVRFPLLPPVEAPAGDDPLTEPEDSEWEAARRDIYGGAPSPDPYGSDAFMQQYGTERRHTEAYSDAKVEVLQKAVLAALKHAARIRHLDHDDFILVRISGPAAGPAKSTSNASYHREISTRTTGAGHNVVLWTGSAPAPDQGSVMTLRAKHSDIAAFAEGSIDQDELRARTQLQIYATGKAPKR